MQLKVKGCGIFIAKLMVWKRHRFKNVGMVFCKEDLWSSAHWSLRRVDPTPRAQPLHLLRSPTCRPWSHSEDINPWPKLIPNYRPPGGQTAWLTWFHANEHFTQGCRVLIYLVWTEIRTRVFWSWVHCNARLAWPCNPNAVFEQSFSIVLPQRRERERDERCFSFTFYQG